jgi:hypothetical protein
MFENPNSTLCVLRFNFAPLRELLFLAGGARKEKLKAQRVECSLI